MLYIAILVLVALINVYFPVTSTSVNEYISDETRALMNSVINGTQTIIMIIFTPIYIKLMMLNDKGASLLFSSVLFLISILMIIPVLKNDKYI